VGSACQYGICKPYFGSSVGVGSKILALMYGELVRFSVVKLVHSYSNFKFDMSVTFMANYYFSGRRRFC
jgi:hypothetical protein